MAIPAAMVQYSIAGWPDSHSHGLVLTSSCSFLRPVQTGRLPTLLWTRSHKPTWYAPGAVMQTLLLIVCAPEGIATLLGGVHLT